MSDLNKNGQESNELNPADRQYHDTFDNLKNSEQQASFNYHPEDENTPNNPDLSRDEKEPGSGGSPYKKKTGNNKSIGNKFKLKAKKLVKNKLLMFGVGGGSGVIVFLLILLVLLVGSLKLPDVMQEIEGYEFATVTGDFNDSATRITEENLAVDATDESTWKGLKNTYDDGGEGSQVVEDSLWDKLSQYNPEAILNNLEESGAIKINFKYTTWGSKQWTGGEIDGEAYTVEDVTGIGKWIPGIRQLLQSNNEAATRSSFLDDLMQNEDVNALGPITKGRFFLTALDATDGSLAGELLYRFRNIGKKPMDTQQAQDEASLQAQQASQAADTVPDNAATSAISEGVEDYTATEDEDEKIPAAVATIVEDGGRDIAAEKSALSNFGGFVNDAVGFINPIYKIILPFCIVYDGSVQQSGPSIANQSGEEEDVFDKLASAADQQKQGDTTNTDGVELANAVKGTNAELGNITNSIPYQRSSGAEVNTAAIPSAEAGSDTSYLYSVFNLFNLSKAESNTLNKIVHPLCKLGTNVFVGLTLGAANLIALGATDGGAEPIEEGADTGTMAYIKVFVTNIKDELFEQIFKGSSPEDINELSNFAKFSRIFRFGFHNIVDELPKIAATLGVTWLAHIVIAERAGAGTNGFAQGSNLVDIADSGANIEANQIARTEFFGRPLTTPQIGQQIQNANHLVAEANASKSFTQRYFALTNADSLFTHLGITLGQYMHPAVISSFIKYCADLLNPSTYIGDLLSFGGIVHASVSPLNQVYGNIQFGWTKSEKALIDSSYSYYPLENQKILDESGEEATIANEYAVCFGYHYNPNGDGNMDPGAPDGDMQPDFSGDEPGSIATLITSQDIVRDNSGNVIANQGLCSPDNLGPNNNQFGPSMVFRWRLAMNYLATLKNLSEEQNITNGT